jgi:hypothetical protein
MDKNNIIYILLDETPYEEHHHGIFSTEKIALEYIATLRGNLTFLTLYMHELDKPEQEGIKVWPK